MAARPPRAPKPFRKRVKRELLIHGGLLAGLGLLAPGGLGQMVTEPFHKAKALAPVQPVKLGQKGPRFRQIEKSAALRVGPIPLVRRARNVVLGPVMRRRQARALRQGGLRWAEAREDLLRRPAPGVWQKPTAGETLGPLPHGARESRSPRRAARIRRRQAWEEQGRVRAEDRGLRRGRGVRDLMELTALMAGASALSGVAAHGIEAAIHSTRQLGQNLHYKRMLAANPGLLGGQIGPDGRPQPGFDPMLLRTNFGILHQLAPALATNPVLAGRAIQSVLDAEMGFTPEHAARMSQVEEQIRKARPQFVEMPGVRDFVGGSGFANMMMGGVGSPPTMGG